MPQPQSLLKPSRPKINWGNPVTKGLVFDAPFWEGAGTFVEDDASPLEEVLGILTSATWDKNFYGTDLDFSAAASRVQFTTPSAVNALPALSVEVLFYFRSLGGGSLGRVVNKGPGTGVTTPWFIFTDTGNFLTFSSGYATSTDNYRGSASLVANTWNHAIFTITMGIGNAPILYFNGVNTSVSRTATGLGAAATDDTNLYIGNRADSTRALDGKIAYTRIWNRLLTPTESRSLYVNPWQVYAEPNRTPSFFSPAVVTATYNAMRMMMGMGM